MGKISQSNLERAFLHHSKNPHNHFREAIREDRESGGLVRSLVIPIDHIYSSNDFLERISEALDYACSIAVRKF